MSYLNTTFHLAKNSEKENCLFTLFKTISVYMTKGCSIVAKST